MKRREFITLVGGATAAWPLAARSQQAAKLPTIGIIDDEPVCDHFRQGLRDLGYVERENVLIEYRSTGGRSDRLTQAALELASLPVNVIVTYGSPATRAARQATSTVVGQQIHVLHANTEREIDAAFARAKELRASAMMIDPSTFFTVRRDQIIGLAARDALPTIYGQREFVTAGGLMSYATNLADAYRQAGVYSGKILNGARPGDLPVVQSAKFELLINLKIAKSLGLTFPPGLLAIADEVIE